MVSNSLRTHAGIGLPVPGWPIKGSAASLRTDHRQRHRYRFVPKRFAIGGGNRPVMNAAISETGTVCQQVFDGDGAHALVRFFERAIGRPSYCCGGTGEFAVIATSRSCDCGQLHIGGERVSVELQPNRFDQSMQGRELMSPARVIQKETGERLTPILQHADEGSAGEFWRDPLV